MSTVQKLKRGQEGFTLIELIVVIAVIGILAAVMLPKYAGFTKSAEKSNVLADAKYLATAVEAMKLEDDTQFTAPKADLPEKIMGYVGKTLGGKIDTAGMTKDGTFTYTKKIEKSGNVYEVQYTASTSAMGDVKDQTAKYKDTEIKATPAK